MKREELLRSEAYWVSKIQIDLFAQIESAMSKSRLSRTGLAEKLGVTKGYISQVLNGNYDHKLSKFVSLAMAIGKVPRIEYIDLDHFIQEDKKGFQITTQKVVVAFSDLSFCSPSNHEGIEKDEYEDSPLNPSANSFNTADMEHNPLELRYS